MKAKELIILLGLIIVPIVCFASEDVKNTSSNTVSVPLAINLSASSTSSVSFIEPLTASFTADQLFDRMEKKSESINAIESSVELSDSVGTSAVTLRVKSPDKFSITFTDGSSSVFFNGSTLWICINTTNECFYHTTEKSSFWEKFGSFSSWFNPKMIFVNMTRSTLNALFKIEALKREKMSDGDYRYHLKLTPKMKEIFIQVFELGYYEVIFSEKLYLPVKVIEYGPNGKYKTTLNVKSYKLNEEVSDDMFVYKNTTKANLVPISIVILQKFEDYKDKLMKKLEDAKESAFNSIMNWSF